MTSVLLRLYLSFVKSITAHTTFDQFRGYYFRVCKNIWIFHLIFFKWSLLLNFRISKFHSHDWIFLPIFFYEVFLLHKETHCVSRFQFKGNKERITRLEFMLQIISNRSSIFRVWWVNSCSNFFLNSFDELYSQTQLGCDALCFLTIKEFKSSCGRCWEIWTRSTVKCPSWASFCGPSIIVSYNLCTIFFADKFFGALERKHINIETLTRYSHWLN